MRRPIILNTPFIVILIGTVFLLYSCKNTTKNNTQINSEVVTQSVQDTVGLAQKDSTAISNALQENRVKIQYASKLRPGQDLELDTIYTDTVTFVKLDTDYDYASFGVEKNKQIVYLIFNNLDGFNRGDQLEINWKLDSFKEAGSGEDKIFESLVAAERIKDGFITALSKGESLSSYFSEDWTLVYHQDNRCDGWTDGFKEGLNTFMIDAAITLEVTNDGKGWACEETNPKTFDYSFNLKEQLKNWDRFEADEAMQDNSSLYLEGAGESDYIILHFNENGEIVKLEYRSEDPG